MHFLKCFSVLVLIVAFKRLYILQEEKLSRLREVVPNPTTEVEPEDSTSISTPIEEEVAEEGQVQGLTCIQHYTQYFQATAELGETLLLGEDAAKQHTTKALEYPRGAAHLQEAAWRMMGVGLHQLHLALAGSLAYNVFEVLQEHFLSEAQ